MKVFASKFKDNTRFCMREALEWLEWDRIVPPDARIFIKPNFTYPFYKPGVTTSPKMIEALVSVLKEQTPNIVIGESDGGNNAWSAADAFSGHDLPEICARYNVKTINLSHTEFERVPIHKKKRRLYVSLPKVLLHEVDVFITMPVPKVHMMTGVSLGFKNQWGCIPDVKRLRYHPHFNHAVVAINKLLKPRLAVFDGTYFLNRTGPMYGDPIKMNLLIASDDVGAGNLACCEIMGINPMTIPHFLTAKREGLLPDSLSNCMFNVDVRNFRRQEKFVLHRSLLNWVALMGFKSEVLTYLGWDSFLAKYFHYLLYSIKGKPNDVNPKW